MTDWKDSGEDADNIPEEKIIAPGLGAPEEPEAEQPSSQELWKQEAAPLPPEVSAFEEGHSPAQAPSEAPAPPPPELERGAYPGWAPPPQSGYGGYPYPQQPYAQQPGWGGSSGAYPPAQPPAPPYGAAPPPQGGWQTPPPPPSQWTFHDYGPLDGEKPPKPKKEKAPKEPREPKEFREKKPRGPNAGLRAFAVAISILFVLTTVGFSGYIVYDLSRENNAAPPATSQGGQESRPQGDSGTASDSPSVRPSADKNADGALSGSEIFSLVEPAVVGIVTYANTPMGYQEASQGSGIVFDENGYIVTNAHVVTDSATDKSYDKISVILSNGDNYPAAIEGKDKDTDLAVLKIEATGLSAAEFGDSGQSRVGDEVFVIGNPNGIKFAGSMAGGYISALNRELRVENMTKSAKYIQTDAAINPGNSGGALVDSQGKIIGITSAKLILEGFEGMGFAIPINTAKPIIESLIQNGYVTGRVQLGISYLPVSEAISELNGLPRGLRVVEFTDGADVSVRENLQLGDIITAMDGKAVTDSDSVIAVLEAKKPGETMKLTVYRVDFETGKSQTLNFDVILSEKKS